VIEPYGWGSGNNASLSVAMAPFEGGYDTSAFQYSTTTLTPLDALTVRSAKGGFSGPMYQSVVVPLMPFTSSSTGATGSKARFVIDNSVVTGTPTGSTRLGNAASIACSLSVAGINGPGTAGVRGNAVAIVTIRGRIHLEDFIGYSSNTSVAAVLPSRLLERSDEKELPPRSVLADRGQSPPPPDDRGWVLTENGRIPSALAQTPLRRPEPIRVVEPAVGTVAVVGDVKPQPDPPNGRTRVR
jgi:hypothetical protein